MNALTRETKRQCYLESANRFRRLAKTAGSRYKKALSDDVFTMGRKLSCAFCREFRCNSQDCPIFRHCTGGGAGPRSLHGQLMDAVAEYSFAWSDTSKKALRQVISTRAEKLAEFCERRASKLRPCK